MGYKYRETRIKGEGFINYLSHKLYTSYLSVF